MNYTLRWVWISILQIKNNWNKWPQLNFKVGYHKCVLMNVDVTCKHRYQLTLKWHFLDSWVDHWLQYVRPLNDLVLKSAKLVSYLFHQTAHNHIITNLCLYTYVYVEDEDIVCWKTFYRKLEIDNTYFFLPTNRFLMECFRCYRTEVEKSLQEPTFPSTLVVRENSFWFCTYLY